MTAREVHLRHALRLSALSVAWSGGVGAIAVAVALVDGSLSLLGFGANAVIDATASVGLIWRFVTERRDPVTAARVERIAERIVGAALIALAAYLLFGAVRSLATQAHPEAAPAGLVLLAASIVVLPPLARAKYRAAAALGSGALRADSILTAVGAILAAVSVVSLGLATAVGLWWADAVGALIVAAIVLREGASSLILASTRPSGARDQ